MPRGPGRDQVPPMERLIRLLTVLGDAARPVGTDTLLAAGGYQSDRPEDAKRMLARDIAQLNGQGWDIRNVADPGEEGRYRLHARDNRLQVSLTPAQRAQLVRAAAAAGRPELAGRLGGPEPAGPAPARVLRPGSPEALDAVVRATSRRCLVRFTYKDRPRRVHPHAVHTGPSGWYLRGREDGEQVVKEFVVARMSDVAIDRPGTAEPLVISDRHTLDPLGWEVDPPLEAMIETGSEHRALVEQLLGSPLEASEADGRVRLTYRVTHRSAFRHRLYELGPRVRVVAPHQLRTEVLDELRAFVESQP